MMMNNLLIFYLACAPIAVYSSDILQNVDVDRPLIYLVWKFYSADAQA